MPVTTALYFQARSSWTAHSSSEYSTIRKTFLFRTWAVN